MQEPEVLLLDEPMAGMNVEEKEDMARFIIDVNELKGTSIILIEHDMGVVMDITERIIVLDFGNKIAEGIAGDIQKGCNGDQSLSRKNVEKSWERWNEKQKPSLSYSENGLENTAGAGLLCGKKDYGIWNE